MSAANDPVPVEQICIGPIKVVELYTASAPDDQPVAECVGTQDVPFDQVRHLVSSKPLARFEHTESAR